MSDGHQSQDTPDNIDLELIKVASNHLDAMTKLLALPIPIIIVTMVALARQKTEVSVLFLSIDIGHAELVARTFLAVIYGQCAGNILVLLSVTARIADKSLLWRCLSLQTGALNPFFYPLQPLRRHTRLSWFFHMLLLPGRFGQLALGSMLGFGGGFRTEYAAGLISHWYRIGSWVAWPFSGSLSKQWSEYSSNVAEYYVGPITFSRTYDAVLTFYFLGVTLGLCVAIISITDKLSENETPRATAFLSLLTGVPIGWFCAIMLSNAIRMGMPLLP